MKQNVGSSQIKLSRRSAIGAAGVCFAMLSQTKLAWSADSVSADAPGAKRKSTFTKDSKAIGMVEISGIHEGKGIVNTKFFRFDGAPWPAHFMIYGLPPGASEGVHTHYLDDHNKQGSFDEYYYIVSGHGQMEIDGEIIPVATGDHIHTPLEVAHGVENTHPSENLRVFLTFIKRGNEVAPMPGSKP
jgi:Cupin domain